MTERKVETDSTVTTETRTFNDLNELTQNVIGSTTWTYTYDDNGNLTSKSDGTDTWAYVWDTDENRLTEVKLNTVTQVTYEYDSLGRLLKRVEGSLTTLFEWDGWDLVKEVKSGSVSETTEYFVPQGEVHSFKRGSSVYHVHGDGLTSTRMVSDSNGNSVADLVYGAWGDVLDESETISGDLDLGFVGGLGVRRDQTTGLLYMRNRWYEPGLSRFISRDPIGHVGGTNLYSYAKNLPMSFLDPYGLDAENAQRLVQAAVDYVNATLAEEDRYGFPEALFEMNLANSRGQVQPVRDLSFYGRRLEGRLYGDGRMAINARDFWNRDFELLKLSLETQRALGKISEEQCAERIRQNEFIRTKVVIEIARVVAHEATHYLDDGLLSNESRAYRNEVRFLRSAFQRETNPEVRAAIRRAARTTIDEARRNYGINISLTPEEWK